MERVKVLQELIRESLYPFDEGAVAGAFLARERRTGADAPFPDEHGILGLNDLEIMNFDEQLILGFDEELESPR